MPRKGVPLPWLNQGTKPAPYHKYLNRACIQVLPCLHQGIQPNLGLFIVLYTAVDETLIGRPDALPAEVAKTIVPQIVISVNARLYWNCEYLKLTTPISVYYLHTNKKLVRVTTNYQL